MTDIYFMDFFYLLMQKKNQFDTGYGTCFENWLLFFDIVVPCMTFIEGHCETISYSVFV